VAHTPNPFDHSGTLDTSNYDQAVQTETFGATGPVTDAGQPTAGARTVTGTPNSVADICAALDQDANLTTVGNNRAAWLAEVTPYVRQSLAQ